MNKDTFIATVGGIGKIKFAPGTFGSLAAFPIIWGFNQILTKIILPQADQVTPQDFINLMLGHLIFLIILFIIGIRAADNYAKNINKDDPKEVVIDEVVGQGLLIWLVTPGIFMLREKIDDIAALILMFILFRLFDIFKPWPVNWAERKFSGGLGIMLDDIVAGIMGAIMFYVILSII